MKKIFWHEPCVFAFSRWIKNGQILFPLKSTFLSKNPGQSGQGPHSLQFTVCTVLQWAVLHCFHLSEHSRIFYDALNCSIALNCQTYVLLYIVQFLLKVTLQSNTAKQVCFRMLTVIPFPSYVYWLFIGHFLCKHTWKSVLRRLRPHPPQVHVWPKEGRGQDLFDVTSLVNFR